MGKINVLDKHVAELIAAGEVVERPSSVIKELAENSIDSGATAITIEIKHGGITFMRVTDNGCGIMKDDIKKAFLRHATSKVKVQNDLDSIGTLGFRGEALASIAAVSKVELLTKAAGDETGTRYVIHGCDEVSFDDAGCPRGTTIIVRDLFYNVPARMKFLKKDVSEANAVAAVVDKIALSHSETAVTFIRDGKKTLVTTGDGNLRNCVYAVCGREFAQGVVPVDYELNGVKVSGYVTKPQAARSSRAMQTFFINGRFVKSRTAMAALEEACKGMVMVGKFPGCVLHITIPPELVDVNVHPAKIEVRFINERPIFDAVYHAVKSAVLKGDTVKNFQLSANNPTENLIDKSVVQKPYTMSEYTVEKIKNSPIIPPSQRKGDFPSDRNFGTAKKNLYGTLDFAKGLNTVVGSGESTVLSDFDDSSAWFSKPAPQKTDSTAATNNSAFNRNYVNIDIAVDDDIPQAPLDAAPKVHNGSDTVHSKNAADTDEILTDANSDNSDTIKPIIPTDDDRIKYIGEAFATYIIAERNNELVFIDKHAAHERMIYEKLKRDMGKHYSQLLLEPVAVTLSKRQYDAVVQNIQMLKETGFEVDDFGQSTVLVRSAPSFVDAFDIPSTIEEMADHILDNKRDISTEHMDWLYHNIACRSAVKGGDSSSPEELIELVKKLDDDVNYKYCPHGRPTSMVITRRELEKQFGRIQ